jgi:hypothetical protein
MNMTLNQTADTVEEVAIDFAALKSEVAPAKKGGKTINPDSGRQAILQVLYHGGTMTPAKINAALKESGREVKYVHSHLNYFKSHGQVLHNQDGTYSLAEKSKAVVEGYLKK